MKRSRLLVLTLFMAFIVSLGGISVLAENTSESATILFTHDMHSHLDSQMTDGKLSGGFGRLKTAIDGIRQSTKGTFLLDAGDFSMGTLYQTVYETSGAELTELGYLGYDATTLGNHEFDYRSEGLANMLNSVKKNSEADPSLQLPALLCANINWDKSTGAENEKIKNAMEAYGSKAYTVIERDGIRMGVFGMMGTDSQACAPLCTLTFDDTIETAKAVVKELESENVDVIVCISHSGTSSNPKKSEDELLAKAVPEINVIVSGHSHTVLPEPIVYGNTYVVSSGSYSSNLGSISLTKGSDGLWSKTDYSLIPIDESVPEDKLIAEKNQEYREQVNSGYLNKFGYSFDETLCENTVNFGTVREIRETRGESTIGSLISDSYMHAVKNIEGDDYRRVDMAIVPSGVIRSSLPIGEVKVSDAFILCSLGIGPNRVPGYPLISVYLTGEELKVAAEVDASVSPLMGGTELFPSGGGWQYNPSRLILNRVTEVWVNDDSGAQQPVNDSELYRVVVDLYSGQMLGAVQGKSFGLLSITPKDKDGNPVSDLESMIIHDADGRELKQWQAVAGYLGSFKDGLPETYAIPQGRKIISNSMNPIELLKNPNKIFWIVLAVLVVLILIIVLIIRVIVVLVKKHKKNKK